MMADPAKPFVEYWISKETVWELSLAVKLLLGVDPDKNKKMIQLSGNEKLTRIYAWAIKGIKDGKLVSIEETPLENGQIEYRVLKKNFIEWAHGEYKDEAESLNTAWKAYKAFKGTPNTDSKIYKQSVEWQELLDKEYPKEFKKIMKVPTHTAMCKKLADDIFPGLKAKEETIRKYTKRRDRNWILGKLEK